MGRIPKLVKERALRELKEQEMRKEAAKHQSTEIHGRESSCSSLSDRSVENYDPNPMETGEETIMQCNAIVQNVTNDSFRFSSITSSRSC